MLYRFGFFRFGNIYPPSLRRTSSGYPRFHIHDTLAKILERRLNVQLLPFSIYAMRPSIKQCHVLLLAFEVYDDVVDTCEVRFRTLARPFIVGVHVRVPSPPRLLLIGPATTAQLPICLNQVLISAPEKAEEILHTAHIIAAAQSCTRRSPSATRASHRPGLQCSIAEHVANFDLLDEEQNEDLERVSRVQHISCALRRN